jgi:hypothetical protein
MDVLRAAGWKERDDGGVEIPMRPEGTVDWEEFHLAGAEARPDDEAD